MCELYKVKSEGKGLLQESPRKVGSEQRYELSRQNLLGIVLFLLFSIIAYSFRDFNLFASASEPLRQVLGYPPPAYLVSLALATYVFSAVTLSLTAMARGDQPGFRWSHLGYRSAFYLFYSFSGSIAANFLAVLITGLGLYLLDQCHIRLFHGKVPNEKELLEKF